jgi:hypothetical protein
MDKFTEQYTGLSKMLEILINKNVKIEEKAFPRTVYINILKLAHVRNKK